MELFGVSDIYKDEKDKNRDPKETEKLMRDADKAFASIQEKLMNDEPISDEEFLEAEQFMEKVTTVLNGQIHEGVTIFAEKADGAPSIIVEMYMHEALKFTSQIISTLSYKRAILSLIRDKYKKKSTISLTIQDKEEQEKTKNKEGGKEE